MKLPPPYQKHDHVGDVLEQRVAAQAHQGKDAQRQQGYGHDHHLSRHWQVEPHQLRVSHQGQQDAGLYRVAGLQHPAHQLAGVSVVGRYRVDIAVFSVVSHR